MPKLTKRIVDAAEAQPVEYFVWDSEIPGFGMRVLPSGRKGYVVQYRAGRRSRRISLGPSTVLTCEQARSRAMAIISAARGGEDPAAERDAGRKAITVRQPTRAWEHAQPPSQVRLLPFAFTSQRTRPRRNNCSETNP